MNLSTSFSLFLSGLLLFVACGCTQTWQSNNADGVDETPPTLSDFTEYAENCADSLLHSMSAEEKAAQLFIPAVYASSDPYNMQKIKNYAQRGIGGLVLLKGDAQSAKIIADSMRRWSKVPPFIAIDAEWGLAMRLKDTPSFPPNSRISDEIDEEILYEYGAEMARECRRLGINMVLGPVLDVAGKDSFIRFRSFGDDPERVSTLSIAYARGLESGNVISVAKHFPGHGAAVGDSHKKKLTIERSLNNLDSVDFLPFKRYIEQRLSAIMVGHLAFPAIDPEMLPAAVSKTVITDLLRNDLGFTGLILTDALNMLGAEGYGADKAIAAGADIILAPADTEAEIGNIKAALSEGTLTASEIDTHVKNIIFKKMLLNAGDEKTKKESSEHLSEELNSPEAAQISNSLK